jgi:pyridoxal phosphate enzyme (YggS family)
VVDELNERIQSIKAGIAESAARSGRTSSDITLIAVSKTRTLDEMIKVAQTGEISVFGENRVQEGVEKIPLWPVDLPLAWHLIGHLQRNKARKALELFDSIQSVDSFKLANTLQRICVEMDRKAVEVFLEVNTSGEASKFGLEPDKAEETCLKIMEKCDRLNVNGLMTIGPLTDDEKRVRSSFCQLRELRSGIESSSGRKLTHLSMGMSGDYQWAIEEGSTMVRIGTALFGPRNYDID